MENPKRYTLTLDDDPSISRIIAQVTGIPSLPFDEANVMIKKGTSLEPVALFIDVNLGTDDCGLDSVPECRKIWPYAPIIVVTSDTKDELIGRALAMGANDFIRKPINPTELTGRLHARILEMSMRRKLEFVEIGDLRFNPIQSSVEKAGVVSYLPKLESQLLAMLLEHRDIIVTREELKQRLWGRIVVSENTLDRKISDIRKALSDIQSICVIQSHYRKGISLSFGAEEQKNSKKAAV